jgi:hypothetical protein
MSFFVINQWIVCAENSGRFRWLEPLNQAEAGLATSTEAWNHGYGKSQNDPTFQVN